MSATAIMAACSLTVSCRFLPFPLGSSTSPPVLNFRYGSSADWPYGKDDFFGTTTTECQAEELAASGKTPAAYLNFPKVVNSVNDRSKFDERKERLMAAGE